jgi:hypothetical protein
MINTSTAKQTAANPKAHGAKRRVSSVNDTFGCGAIWCIIGAFFGALRIPSNLTKTLIRR